MNFFLILITSIAFPTLCIAASFDCQKASSTIEKVICSNAELSTEDENLSSAYKDALKNTSEKKTVIISQREWIRSRNVISDPVEMLMMYRNRILELNREETPKKRTIDEYKCTSWGQKKPLSNEFNKLKSEIYYAECSDKPLNKIIKIGDVILYPSMSVEDPYLDVSLSEDGNKLIFALTTVWEKNVWVINIKTHKKEFFSDIFPGRQLLINWIDRNRFSLTYCGPGYCNEYIYKFDHNKWELSKTEHIEEGD